jgi:hypothetical protein
VGHLVKNANCRCVLFAATNFTFTITESPLAAAILRAGHVGYLLLLSLRPFPPSFSPQPVP